LIIDVDMCNGSFNIGQVEIGLNAPLFVMAGPCVIESETQCLDIAGRLVEIGERTGTAVIFKASFDKANRSSLRSSRGLTKVRLRSGLAVMTDVHEPSQAGPVAAVVDCLQIPAFLCRQTDLLCACARTRKPVNVKKGQFLAPDEMRNVVDKIRGSDNEQIVLTERGTFFGYNRLVNDMTAIDAMRQLGSPVVFDATHSTQRPGALGSASGGQREMAPILAKAAVAAGADGLFLEVHTEPEQAKSDAACIMPLDWLEELVTVCKEIFEIVRG